MQVYVQKSTSTTFPRSPSAESGGVLSHAVAPRSAWSSLSPATLPDSALPVLAYDLTTTATFTPPAKFCVAFPTLANPTAHLPLYKLYHREGTAYVDRTSSRDAATKTLCADITALGRVVVGGPEGRRRAVGR